jgi:hypothetical protein
VVVSSFGRDLIDQTRSLNISSELRETINQYLLPSLIQCVLGAVSAMGAGALFLVIGGSATVHTKMTVVAAVAITEAVAAAAWLLLAK